jgi:hypothetical protein
MNRQDAKDAKEDRQKKTTPDRRAASLPCLFFLGVLGVLAVYNPTVPS